MKAFNGYHHLFWLPVFSIIWLTGCSEDISVVKPGPPVPVVYGIFDVNQPVQYIKLSKSFAGTTDPYTLAMNHDNIFYPEAQVFLTEVQGTGRIPFHRETGIPRSPGYFPEYPNEVYASNQKLHAGSFVLTVILPSEQDTLTALFTFIETLKVIIPKAGLKRFYFYEDPILFSWISDPAAGLYEITIKLKYEEWTKTGDSKICSVSFTRRLHPSELESDQGRYGYRFYSDSFFAYLSTNIQQDISVDFRKPVYLELLITAADTTLAKYLNWLNLEIDDKVNPNGNVKGAIGVVGTKFTAPFPDLILSARSQDSLVKGRFTKKLDFVNNPDW